MLSRCAFLSIKTVRYMAVRSEALIVGRCYLAANGEVRKIVSFDGGRVVYVVERGGMYPIWNKRDWIVVGKPDFAQQAVKEVVCC